MVKPSKLRYLCILAAVACWLPTTLDASGIPNQVFTDWFDDLSENGAETAGLTTFPTLEIPVGGEHEALATAYTAGARDASYFEANPAASADLAVTELAVFHNNLVADTSMEAISYTTRFEDLGIGFAGKSLHVPFTGYDSFGAQESTGRYRELVLGANVAYNFFDSFYYSGLGVGMNVKLAYRNIPAIIAPGQNALGTMVDVGLLTRFNVLKFYSSRARNAAVGLVLKNFGPNVNDEPLPTEAVAGIAFSPLRPVMITTDAIAPFNLLSPQPAESLGIAAGVAIAATEFFSVRGGFLLRNGNPRLSVGAGVDLDRITLTANYTLDMTTQIVGLDRFSIQAGFSFGDRGRAEREERVRELYLDSLEAFASGDLARTILLAGQAAELDPSFQPATETVALAEHMLLLQQGIEAIRTSEETIEAEDSDE